MNMYFFFKDFQKSEQFTLALYSRRQKKKITSFSHIQVVTLHFFLSYDSHCIIRGELNIKNNEM